jgi:hypothetical protein
MNASSPQAKETAHESMVLNLAALAEAIWPQEEPIVGGARFSELKEHPVPPMNTPIRECDSPASPRCAAPRPRCS